MGPTVLYNSDKFYQKGRRSKIKVLKHRQRSNLPRSFYPEVYRLFKSIKMVTYIESHIEITHLHQQLFENFKLID